jgi:alpha-methylacyl-CoA racemase
MLQPLTGVKVLDLTRLLPGAVATMMLADMGADVIKVEDPNGGDYVRWMPPQINGQSVFFRMNNRAKRSIILNLKDERGQDILKQLVKEADILIEGFRPDVMRRLNVDYEQLKQVNPRLIYCSLSGWGADGPYRTLGGHDLNYTSLAGVTGGMEHPQVLGAQVADIGGAYNVVGGICALLFQRERTGQGAYLDVSLAESALPFALYNWVESHALGVANGASSLTGGLAFYRIYQAKDGQAVSLGALEEKFWLNFCQAVERPDLIPLHNQLDQQKQLRDELTALFAQKTASEWEASLDGVDCCFMRARPAGELHLNEHLQARDMLGIHDDGTYWMRSPIRVSDFPLNHTIPDYGEHTAEVLREIGLGQDQIENLQNNGVIR